MSKHFGFSLKPKEDTGNLVRRPEDNGGIVGFKSSEDRIKFLTNFNMHFTLYKVRNCGFPRERKQTFTTFHLDFFKKDQLFVDHTGRDFYALLTILDCSIVGSNATRGSTVCPHSSLLRSSL
jgi:hypothetical protein